MKIFRGQQEFEWDSGNSQKNVVKHGVTNEECEEVFFDPQKKILRDVLHSHKEKRYLLLGKTKHHRALFVVFTLRKSKIRVISARDLNKKERQLL
ncbi:MAG: BrnT family toxin [Candidatus Kerfeldbacteria bacterium]|nr:BrnT family toxin [Candidatus Kerfeldbacteria bacterium]